ncbi:MAG: dienelactone hydrolase family protein [Synechococcales bacterium]|nr:dienelactone hydrolase family protein [Synechococcales bacterium]
MLMVPDITTQSLTITTQSPACQPEGNSSGDPGSAQTTHLQLEAYLAAPTAPGIYPAILVIQEVFGVNAHIREVADRLAREGYVAIAPNIFQRTAPGLDLGYSDAELALGRSHKDQTIASQLLGDLQAIIAYLYSLPQVKSGGVGVIGFCFGGHVAYLAGVLPDVKAIASLYGSGVAVMTPGGGQPTLGRTREITGQVYAFFGTQDPLIPNEQADAIEAELIKWGVDHQIFRYEAGHGFFCDRRDSYNAVAAQDAWEQIKVLFRCLK